MIQRFDIKHRARAGAAAVAAGGILGSALLAAPALAGGGVSATPAHHRTVAGPKAKLRGQVAYAPASAPPAIKAAINAANKIARGHAYMLGGGHEYKNGHPIWNPQQLAKYQGVRKSKYDCSGTVSYVLHAAHAISTPEPSGPMEHWGVAGKGRWISVYANGGHAWMTIAGLRFDTSDTPGSGPGWAKTMGYEDPSAFKVRHKAGL